MSFSVPNLKRVGWQSERFPLNQYDFNRIVRVIEVHRDTIRVTNGLRTFVARLHPQLLHEPDMLHNPVTVGDWVILTASSCSEDDQWVEARLPAYSRLVRRDGSGLRHVIVSNVDVAFVVMGLDSDFNLRRLERYLAIVHICGSRVAQVRPIVVLTKCDLVSTSASLAAQILARIGSTVEVLHLNGLSPDTGAILRPYVPIGCTAVLIGSSGAGKSTLTNAIVGAVVQDTGAVRASDERGQHTTTARSLHLIPEGGCVIDTPGIRTLSPDADSDTLKSAFEDISRFAPQCKFRNCTHTLEPGCQVRAHVEEDRVENFQKMLRDAKRDSMTYLERRAQLGTWKSRAKNARAKQKAGLTRY